MCHCYFAQIGGCSDVVVVVVQVVVVVAGGGGIVSTHITQHVHDRLSTFRIKQFQHTFTDKGTVLARCHLHQKLGGGLVKRNKQCMNHLSVQGPHRTHPVCGKQYYTWPVYFLPV